MHADPRAGSGTAGGSAAHSARPDGGLASKQPSSVQGQLAPAPASTQQPVGTANPRKKSKKKMRGSRPLRLTPPLGVGRYVFPVVGAASFIDTYGNGRSDVSGGWHHGDDIFAPLGQPVVAVADGTINRVGWNPVGGWRLWLQDRNGDSFYYAHLSGYTRLAREGETVKAGEQLGFVGNTGDAFTTAHHLHFEVHPASLDRLGYDGAVDPTTYLNSWRRVQRVEQLPPVALPAGGLRHGEGSALDYEQLLRLEQTTLLPLQAQPQPQLGSQPKSRSLRAPRSLRRSGRLLANGVRRERLAPVIVAEPSAAVLELAAASVVLPQRPLTDSRSPSREPLLLWLLSFAVLVVVVGLLVCARQRGGRVARAGERSGVAGLVLEQRSLDWLLLRSRDNW